MIVYVCVGRDRQREREREREKERERGSKYVFMCAHDHDRVLLPNFEFI